MRPKNLALLLYGREILVPERILSHLEVRKIDRRQVVWDQDAPQIQYTKSTMVLPVPTPDGSIV